MLLAVLVRQSGLCALLPGTVLPQAALATPPAPLSGNRSDTIQHVELSFRFDRSLLDSAYRDNSSALHTLRNWLGPSCCASRIDSIGIFPTLPWKVTAGTTDSWRVTGAGPSKVTWSGNIRT
ncbi:MAG: hypothetical protein ACLR1G_15375 [Alistipes indistinctus]